MTDDDSVEELLDHRQLIQAQIILRVPIHSVMLANVFHSDVWTALRLSTSVTGSTVCLSYMSWFFILHCVLNVFSALAYVISTRCVGCCV